MNVPFEATLSFSRRMDDNDPLRSYRNQFLFPYHKGEPVLYFCGNSLGLQPTTVRKALEEELQQWQNEGVEGWFRGRRPWLPYHQYMTPTLAEIVGAKVEEVTVMNTLTVNLHLLMVSFYRPTRNRFKIIMEGGAFPSDQYAVETQVRFHGFDPEEAIIEILPREGEHVLRTEDIVKVIQEYGQETALILFGGINYYTGQFYDLSAITEAGHRAGAKVGFDLAHAVGNVPLQLHSWGADFAVWCSYKYLNAGPGGPGGVFVHERHFNNPDMPRFAGWWGYEEKKRFLMAKGFVPAQGADSWQVSTATIFGFAAHRASLEYFAQTGMNVLREKSLKLTGYLEFLIHQLKTKEKPYQIITPGDPSKRGCQLSILTGTYGKNLFDYLAENGVICDWREPNVIRVAPVPLYNSFEDVFQLAELLKKY